MKNDRTKEKSHPQQDQYQKTVEELNRTFQEHVDRLEDKITAQNSKISEVAIDKLLKLLNPILISLGSVIVIFSFLGYGDLKESVTSMAKTKINAWLSYDEKNSPINDTILPIRDRYLIDSVYIRYMRSKANSRYSDFKINDKELDDLIRIANNKETSLQDYSDILNLYGSHFIMGSIKFRGNFQANLFGKIMTEGGYKEQFMKQREFLSVFSHDISANSYAKEILESDSDYLKYEAFTIAANTNPKYAIEYANKNLSSNNFEHIDQAMALLLVQYDTESEIFKSYVNELFNVRYELDLWLHKYLEIFSYLIRKKSKLFTYELHNNKSDEIRNKMAFSMFSKLVNEGYFIGINNQFEPKLTLSKLGSSSAYLSRIEVEKIYENPNMLNKIIHMNSNDVSWLSKVVYSMEVYNNDEYLVTLMVDLGTSSQITLNNEKSITSDDVLGAIWLTIDRNNKNKLEVAFRDKSGKLQRYPVLEFKNFENSSYSYRFVEKDLYAFTAKENNL